MADDNPTKTILDECWEWSGYRDPDGYGRVSITRGGKKITTQIHRLILAWVNWNGEGDWWSSIPAEIFACHRCDNPPCCNPRHLFLGTHTDNMRDSLAKNRHYKTKQTHCKRGHEYTKENTHRSVTRRFCRACWRENYRRYKTRRELAAGECHG